VDRQASVRSAGLRVRAVPLRHRWRSLGLEPVLRLLGWALRTLAGRLGLALLAPFSSAPARQARRRAWSARSLEALVGVLGRLKGAFVKAGQFAAHRHDVLPPAAAPPLARLRDRVPPLELAEIRPLLEAELGAPLETLFASFDAEPLGSASVAQVHRARLPSGEDVAVKVQYPWLEAALPADLAVVRALLALGARISGARGLDAARLTHEFESGLRDELDFEREARAAREIAANLAHDPQIVVPAVVPSHSRRRVLTTSFHPAVPIGDRDALRRLGVAPREVLRVVARAYAKQVFVDGLFHADPHPGNLFVLDEPDAAARPRVLFVDFGLSRRLDPALRREMRLGAYALLQRDQAAFVAGMQRMGMIAPGAEPGVRRAVGHMFGRLSGEGGPLGLAGSSVLGLKDEAVALLRETGGLQLPHDLLLFAKTLSYVFALGRELDAEVDLMQVSLPYLLRFLGTPSGPDAGPGGG
jgi:predicted unusual protein kinase regulating ubiquinone biosynthesis (AarF/ABC1/UbiB family)